MTEDEIRDLIKQHLSVEVVVSSGPEVEVILMWDGKPFTSARDLVSTGQSGPQD